MCRLLQLVPFPTFFPRRRRSNPCVFSRQISVSEMIPEAENRVDRRCHMSCRLALCSSPSLSSHRHPHLYSILKFLCFLFPRNNLASEHPRSATKLELYHVCARLPLPPFSYSRRLQARNPRQNGSGSLFPSETRTCRCPGAHRETEAKLRQHPAHMPLGNTPRFPADSPGQILAVGQPRVPDQAHPCSQRFRDSAEVHSIQPGVILGPQLYPPAADL
mmetsp:Transcript_28424/g.53248  ORF Transcript_28424/g.53248 Transcript_28424/m.53248 type:complete len:218 (-) Transcript_28424:184-837(-)